MSLNNISLSSQLLTELYQISLVQGVVKAVPFWGNNQKNILLAVNNQDIPFLPKNELDFLTTVLSACSLSLSDVAIINMTNPAAYTADDVLQQVEPRQVVLFNVEPAQFGLAQDIQNYKVTIVGNRQLVSAPSLTEIEEHKEAKKQLWLALKQLFGI